MDQAKQRRMSIAGIVAGTVAASAGAAYAYLRYARTKPSAAQDTQTNRRRHSEAKLLKRVQMQQRHLAQHLNMPAIVPDLADLQVRLDSHRQHNRAVWQQCVQAGKVAALLQHPLQLHDFVRECLHAAQLELVAALLQAGMPATHQFTYSDAQQTVQVHFAEWAVLLCANLSPGSLVRQKLEGQLLEFDHTLHPPIRPKIVLTYLAAWLKSGTRIQRRGEITMEMMSCILFTEMLLNQIPATSHPRLCQGLQQMKTKLPENNRQIMSRMQTLENIWSLVQARQKQKNQQQGGRPLIWQAAKDKNWTFISSVVRPYQDPVQHRPQANNSPAPETSIDTMTRVNSRHFAA